MMDPKHKHWHCVLWVYTSTTWNCEVLKLLQRVYVIYIIAKDFIPKFIVYKVYLMYTTSKDFLLKLIVCKGFINIH